MLFGSSSFTRWFNAWHTHMFAWIYIWFLLVHFLHLPYHTHSSKFLQSLLLGALFEVETQQTRVFVCIMEELSPDENQKVGEQWDVNGQIFVGNETSRCL